MKRSGEVIVSTSPFAHDVEPADDRDEIALRVFVAMQSRSGLPEFHAEARLAYAAADAFINEREVQWEAEK